MENKKINNGKRKSGVATTTVVITDEDCNQQMEESVKFKDRRQKWGNFYNNSGHSTEECYQQENGRKYMDIYTVDGKNSETHETYDVDSTILDCKSYCCYGKIGKKSIESEIKYLQPPEIIVSFGVYYIPLFHQADGFQLSVDSESSTDFIDPKLIREVENRMLDYTEMNLPMKIKH